MIIKDKIQIGTRTFTIEYIPNLRDDENNELYGRENTGRGLIQINSDYPEDVQEQALIHEIRHIILEFCGYASVDKIDNDESFLERMENYDHQVMLQIIEWQK